jgi:hypothetical protein
MMETYQGIINLVFLKGDVNNGYFNMGRENSHSHT